MSKLFDNIWWTRKARIQAEKRLLSTAFQAEMLLLWYSFVSLGVSIYQLLPESSAKVSPLVWVVFSVLIMSVSSFISGLSLKERAGLVKECYEALNVLCHSAKDQNADIEEVGLKYQKTLACCENHTDLDYFKAVCLEYLQHSAPNNPESGLTRRPNLYIWFRFLFSTFFRSIVLLALYSLPVILLFSLRCFA